MFLFRLFPSLRLPVALGLCVGGGFLSGCLKPNDALKGASVASVPLKEARAPADRKLTHGFTMTEAAPHLFKVKSLFDRVLKFSLTANGRAAGEVKIVISKDAISNYFELELDVAGKPSCVSRYWVQQGIPFWSNTRVDLTACDRNTKVGSVEQVVTKGAGGARTYRYDFWKTANGNKSVFLRSRPVQRLTDDVHVLDLKGKPVFTLVGVKRTNGVKSQAETFQVSFEAPESLLLDDDVIIQEAVGLALHKGFYETPRNVY